MLEEIIARRDEIAALCRKHYVLKLAVFGSALREDFDPARSDIDFRVEFGDVPPGRCADNYFDLIAALETLFARRSETNIFALRSSQRKRPFMPRSLLKIPCGHPTGYRGR